MPVMPINCPTCGRTVYKNEIRDRELFNVIFNCCPHCLADLEAKVQERLKKATFESLDYGNQQRVIRERAAESARSDFNFENQEVVA